MTTAATTRQQFEALVRRAEQEIVKSPQRYKLRLTALVALGYVVIFALLILLVGLLGGSIYAATAGTAMLLILIKSKVFFLIIVPIWVLFRSLFTRIREPDGLTLSRQEFPAVWAEIDSLRAKVDGLPIHRVVLVPEINAAVTQTPRLGIFGPSKNTLVLGLELLMSLSPTQARAVLAHEFGHLSGQHGRFGTWIYRKRLTWARIHMAFEDQPTFGTGLIRRFIRWYVPKLAGYSFVLARQQEYEADAVAGRLTSPQDIAAALVVTGSRAQITAETFWKPLIRTANVQPEPESHVYAQLLQHLKVPPDASVAHEKITQAMRRTTDYADTHPALKDRLAALAMPPLWQDAGPVMAAEAWLGSKLDTMIAACNRTWLASNGTEWQARYKFAQAAGAHLLELDQKRQAPNPTGGPILTRADAWDYATLTEEFRPEIDPLPLYHDCKLIDAATGRTTDGRADLAIGQILLSKHNHSGGIDHLMQAAAANPMQLREPALYLIAGFFTRQGQHEIADTWRVQAEQAGRDSTEAQIERNAVTANDRFKPSRLTAAEQANVSAAVKQTTVGASIKTIWIVEKQVQQFPAVPVHVVLVQPTLFAFDKADIAKKLVQEIGPTQKLVGDWFFIADVGHRRPVAKKIKAVQPRQKS
jgi:Zn-dependent protease with chaperone function